MANLNGENISNKSLRIIVDDIEITRFEYDNKNIPEITNEDLSLPLSLFEDNRRLIGFCEKCKKPIFSGGRVFVSVVGLIVQNIFTCENCAV